MNKAFNIIISPTVMLYFLLILAQFIGGIYIGLDTDIPANIQLLYWISFMWAIGWWLVQDNRTYKVSWMHDMGLLLYLAWPLVVPAYLIKTRRIKAIRTILVFVGIFITATIVGAIVGSILLK